MSNRRQDHYEERAAQKVSDAKSIQRQGKKASNAENRIDLLLWDAAELLTKARLAA